MSVCISGLLYDIAGISSYIHGILYMCYKFVGLYGSFSTLSFYSSSVFCFNFGEVGTSLNFSWNVFWVVSTSVSVESMVVCRFYWCNNYLQENYSVSAHALLSTFSKIGSLEAVIVAHYFYFSDLFKRIVCVCIRKWMEGADQTLGGSYLSDFSQNCCVAYVPLVMVMELFKAK
jgi:hypothetical protein